MALTEKNQRRRQGLISASNIGMLMMGGKHRQRIIEDLAKARLGEPTEFITNEAIKRGVYYEPIALDCFNETKAEKVGKVFAENKEFFYADIEGVRVGATPDGLSDDGYSLEIKTPMEANYEKQSENPPLYYQDQCLFQRLVMAQNTGGLADYTILFYYSPEQKQGIARKIVNDDRIAIMKKVIVKAESDINEYIRTYGEPQEETAVIKVSTLKGMKNLWEAQGKYYSQKIKEIVKRRCEELDAQIDELGGEIGLCTEYQNADRSELPPGITFSSASAVMVEDMEVIPEKYKKRTVTLDKAALRRDLKAGIAVAGCRLDTAQTPIIRAKPVKQIKDNLIDHLQTYKTESILIEDKKNAE